MRLVTEPYREQAARWPRDGRHILAQYDEERVVVYQPYRPEIGRFAAAHGFFGGDFSLSRMSWIKPNFLWMMYRSGWGTKEGQEVTLAVSLRREAFDSLLAQAVHSSYDPGVYASEAAWREAVSVSEVRLQWDPDHAPSGAPLIRRALQLGLRVEALRRYACEWLLDIEDISDFVREQRPHAAGAPYDDLITPREHVYPVTDPGTMHRLGLALEAHQST